jgi:large subunit ribosomal protein L19
MSARDILEKIERENLKKSVTGFRVGDTVKVHTKVTEGGRNGSRSFKGSCWPAAAPA